MGKITDIVPQKKDQKRVNVFIDQKFAFGISAGLRFEKKLEVERKVTEKQKQDLIRADQVERLLNKAFRFLSYRPRSEKELRDHLLRKGKLKEVKSEPEKNQYEISVTEVIRRLKKLGQVDDRAFASWWVEQRTRFKPRGKNLLKSELASKGVGRETIDELVDFNKEDQTQQAMAAAAKKIASYKKLDDKAYRIKLGQFLVRRGFSWEVAKKAVDTLVDKR
ncbi:MAG TPA: RecX family transcriptional regulator [Candidatus Nanoarchaeia archaeon]